MLRLFPCLSTGILFLLVCPSSSPAQSGVLWTEGQWSVPAPSTGSCGSLPLLQVKGSGSILDSQNAGMLAHLQAALPSALGKVCPGVREVILVSGRGRKLIKVDALETVGTKVETPGASPAGEIKPKPSSTPTEHSLPVSSPVREGGVNAKVTSTASAGAAPPRFLTSSSLPSLASAHSTQAKCDVLLKWLESGKTAAGRPGVLPAEMLSIFSDSDMLAVFGTTYDGMSNSKRIDLSENLISKCTGQARRQPPQRPVVIGGYRIPNIGGFDGPLPREYAQEFQQYRQLLEQAFQGTPGRFEPAAITRYASESRAQLNWANNAMQEAASAGANIETFSRMDAQRNAAAKEMNGLSPAERQAFTNYLDTREGELAPTIIQGWLSEAQRAPKTLASAQALAKTRRQLDNVYRRVPANEHTAIDGTFWQIADNDIRESVAAEIQKLNQMPATWNGAQQLARWETDFLRSFGEFRPAASLGPAAEEFTRSREKIYRAALQEWKKSVGATPVEPTAIEAKRNDLNAFFPDGGDRSSALFSDWDAPLQAKQVQLQAKLAEAERKLRQDKADAIARSEELQRKQLEANAIYRDGPTGPITTVRAGEAGASDAKAAARVARANQPLVENSLVTLHLTSARAYSSIYVGDFSHVPMRRTERLFGAVLTEYMEQYNDQCGKYLPANPVPITMQECAVTTTQVSGWGAGNSWCSSYRTVPTGRWADPELYAASKRLVGAQTIDTLKSVFSSISASDPFGSAIQKTGSIVSSTIEIQADMTSIVQMNGCANPALIRFQNNLLRYAVDGEPIRISPATASR